MRAQIAKTAHLPAEYIPLAFLTRTPSPYSAGSSWGLLSRKIFYFFLNPLSTRSNYTSIFIFFLIFARNHRMSGLKIFWILHSLFLPRIIFLFFFVTSFLSDSYSILFRISIVLTHYKFSLDILLVWFRYIFLDYNFGFCVFRLIFTRWILLASISTCFSIVDSTFWLFCLL